MDGVSSLLKHIQPEHIVHPTCKVVLRIIRSMFYVLHACLQVVSTLRIAGNANFNIKMYHSLQKALTLIMPTFQWITSDIAECMTLDMFSYLPSVDPTSCNDTQPLGLPTNECTQDSTHAAHQHKKVFIAYKKLQLGYQSSTTRKNDRGASCAVVCALIHQGFSKHGTLRMSAMGTSFPARA